MGADDTMNTDTDLDSLENPETDAEADEFGATDADAGGTELDEKELEELEGMDELIAYVSTDYVTEAEENQLEGLSFEDIKPYVSMYQGDDGKMVYDVLDKDEKSDKKFADSKEAMAYLSKNYNRLKQETVEAEVPAEHNSELDRIKLLANIQ